ncbi:MAG TPA: SPOR domain-containing protein [Pyrinomonadaceae bacterium]|nr:SPOR domain-containing protein [Pyrinomonadaceae bacterium]
MRIVCPKCELKGQVDFMPSGAKTRIACVRCAATFDAVFIDGEVQALTPQAAPVETALESAGNDVLAAVAGAESAHETLQDAQMDASMQLAAQPAPTDDFSTSSPNLMFKESSEASAAMGQETDQDFARLSGEHKLAEMPFGVQPSVDEEPSAKSNGAGKVSRPPTDAYGLGVRLMRVSPMWLLVAGLSFISFIVLCNWLIKPVEPTDDAQSMLAAANSHATNQSQSRIAVSNTTAQSPVNTQPVQPANESGAAFIPAQAEQTPAAQTVTVAETVKEKFPVEEKAAAKEAAPAAQSNSPVDAKAGKVTIQIGSYNESSQAEERVANLKSAGYEARSVPVEIPKRGTWYRVQSGHFISRDEAERYGRQLKDKGVVSSFITTDVQE